MTSVEQKRRYFDICLCDFVAKNGSNWAKMLLKLQTRSFL